MNEPIPRRLAVVGFSEYKSQIKCVDGWFAAGDPRAEEYDMVIEKAGERIRVREHLKQDRVPWFQFEGDFYDDQYKGLLWEVVNKFNSLTGDQSDFFIVSAPIIEKRKTPIAAFWLPSPEENTVPEN